MSRVLDGVDLPGDQNSPTRPASTDECSRFATRDLPASCNIKIVRTGLLNIPVRNGGRLAHGLLFAERAEDISTARLNGLSRGIATTDSIARPIGLDPGAGGRTTFRLQFDLAR